MDPQVISKISIRNFRNLGNIQLDFSSRINCITGDNGNGKTNILEAVHFLINRKSFHKNTSFPQILSTECGQPEIIFNSLFLNRSKEIHYSGKWSREGHSWFINGKKNKNRIDLKNIFIGPFDSLNFYSSPNSRRIWFDKHARKLNKEYDSLYIKYHKLLKFRNTLLTNKSYKFLEQIRAIDSDLCPISFEIHKLKKILISEINDFSENIFKEIFSDEHKIELKLKSSILQIQDSSTIQKVMFENLEKDKIIGHTSKGIHKDYIGMPFRFHKDLIRIS